MRMTLWVAVCLAFAGAGAAQEVDVSAKRLMRDVKELASPKYEGRMSGTPGIDRAAAYIAKSFEKAGLRKPFGEAGKEPGYLQKFLVSTEAKLGAANGLRVNDKDYAVSTDFVPRIFSSSGEVTGGMVFVGYSITAAEYHYDDYAGLDLKGKIAVVLRYEPQDAEENSIWEGKKRTRHAGLDAKVINAKQHGAVGVILLNNGVTYPEEKGKLDDFDGQTGAAELGIPVVQVRADVAEAWFAEAKHDLNGIVKAIDRTGGPQSFRFPETWKATLRVEIDRRYKPTYNVAGFLPGETDEYVVVGAHYDHLGMGQRFSMATDGVGKLHPGADDNASGTSAVLELARQMAKGTERGRKLRRGILFVAFAGEEIGLLGSAHLAGNLPYPLAKCVAMVNMDMVGRMREGKFFLVGVASGKGFRAVAEKALEGEAGLKPDYGEALNIGGSDHSSFTARGVPALFFFSGLHEDYHKPTDTWDKMVPREYARLVRVVAKTVVALAQGEERVEFQRPAMPAVSSAGGGAGVGAGGSGYGPYFGSVPDFASVPGGVRLADIRKGSPADEGGILPGDILIEFDGKLTGGLEEYTYVLRGKKAGDEVMVKVKRGNEILEKRVKLGERR
ncbi:MAG: M28 family peptidase [Bryobacter sp.]|nr:M28 family peptidase [Bryobacter sp.]